MSYFNYTTWNDRWIIEEIFHGKRNGFYVEAGASGGKKGSCTYLLEKEYDWAGILIEPSEFFFKSLIEKRPKSICVNECLFSSKKMVDFVEIDNAEKKAGFSGIKEVWPESAKTELCHYTHKIRKKLTTTLEEVLDRYHAPKIIDYLALDVEKSEYEVLRHFPFDRYLFKAVSIEGNPARTLLRQNGYVQVDNPFSESNHENYFVHKSFIKITTFV